MVTKSALRKIALAKLNADAKQRGPKSSLIWEQLVELDSFKRARKDCNVMTYLDFGTEVQTTRFLPLFLDIPQNAMLSASRQYRETMATLFGNSLPSSDIFRKVSSVIVPFCEEGEIIPLIIHTLDELESGAFGIREPKEVYREEIARQVPPDLIDFVLVPGLAFDRQGNRLGRGAGYYDRFLSKISPRATIIALAFECQLFESIPVEPQDIPVNMIITEDRTLVIPRKEARS